MTGEVSLVGERSRVLMRRTRAHAERSSRPNEYPRERVSSQSLVGAGGEVRPMGPNPVAFVLWALTDLLWKVFRPNKRTTHE